MTQTKPLGQSPVKTDDNPVAAEFYKELRSAWDRAVKPYNEAYRCYFRVATKTVELQFAGDTLAEPLTKAIAHLRVEECPAPDLVIRLWDTTSTSVNPPTSPWSNETQVTRGELSELESKHFKAAFSIGSGMLSMLDEQRNEAIVWLRDVSKLPQWELAAPFRSILSWWATACGFQLAHTAAVGLGSNGVLITARGGSGKSTTALSCLDAGMSYAADDYALLRLQGDEQLFVHSIYNTAKLEPKNLYERLPQLAACLNCEKADDMDKLSLYLQDSYPQQLAESFEVRAVVIPRLAEDGVARLSKASATAVLRALAPTTCFQLPYAGRAAFQFLASAVRRVPGYYLDLSPTLGSNVDKLKSLL